jgi:hypothetical protein
LRDGNVDKEILEYLLSIGAVEFVYKDQDGEEIYRFTKIAKELVPQIYNEHMKDFNAMIFSLWRKELIDIVFDEVGEPLIGINENSYNEEMQKDLSVEEKDALIEIFAAWDELDEG